MHGRQSSCCVAVLSDTGEYGCDGSPLAEPASSEEVATRE